MSGTPTTATVTTVFFAPVMLIAALVLLVREVAPALSALASGRIRSQGHSRRIIERRSEPERFEALVKRRLMVGGTGFVFCIVFGVATILRSIQLGELMS